MVCHYIVNGAVVVRCCVYESAQMLSSPRKPYFIKINPSAAFNIHYYYVTSMDANSLHEFRRKASFFFREKINAARLALTDVTPAQLLTEEATDGDYSVPDTRSMRLISRAAFEVDDYCRVVDILHNRLRQYNRKHWRASYRALILLEHLLTHGPASIAEEFECDKEIIREMENFQYVDEKGFNWGLTVQRKGESVMKLIEDCSFRNEERDRARKLTSGIKGFGSFCNRLAPTEGTVKDAATTENYVRCNSHFNDYPSRDDEVLDSKEGCIQKLQPIEDEFRNIALETHAVGNGFEIEDGDHPFCDKKNQALVSLLSS